MNFWETMWSPIRSWFGGRQASGTQITGPLGYGYSASVEVTEETALQVSAVWACVRLISQAVASLPLIVYRKTDKGREAAEDHWFAELMRGKPNQYQTRYEFWEHQIANLALHGNLYAKKTIRANRVVGLLPLNPLQVETKLVEGRVVHHFTHDGNITALAAESVWHARMNGDLIVGRSPLQFGRNLLAIAQAADQVTSNIYANGGKPSGVLSFDRLLTPEQRAQIRDNFSTLTTGTDERLLVLELGAKFEPVSMSPMDIELLASRKFQIEEICRWFGVPSVLVNDTSGSTTWGSGIEQLVTGFYKLNLRPYLEALENSISTHLFNDADRREYEVEFDFEGLLRADQKTRFEGYRTAIASGLMTPNEARGLEWLPAVEGGDQLLIQGAMVPVKDAGKKPEPPASQPTPPQGDEEPDGTENPAA
jgi:HK97 family phage portal protein